VRRGLVTNGRRGDDDLAQLPRVHEHGSRSGAPVALNRRVTWRFQEPADELGAAQAGVRARKEDAVAKAVGRVLGLEKDLSSSDRKDVASEERLHGVSHGKIGLRA
jgi:hypothetical protein